MLVNLTLLGPVLIKINTVSANFHNTRLSLILNKGTSINYVVPVGGRGVAPKTIYYIDLT